MDMNHAEALQLIEGFIKNSEDFSLGFRPMNIEIPYMRNLLDALIKLRHDEKGLAIKNRILELEAKVESYIDGLLYQLVDLLNYRFGIQSNYEEGIKVLLKKLEPFDNGTLNVARIDLKHSEFLENLRPLLELIR